MQFDGSHAYGKKTPALNCAPLNQMPHCKLETIWLSVVYIYISVLFDFNRTFNHLDFDNSKIIIQTDCSIEQARACVCSMKITGFHSPLKDT